MSELKQYSLDEVKTHNKPDDLWVIIRGKVYDVSKFRHEHPGGSDVLEDVAGKDGTTDFIEVGHSKDAEKQMKSYLIGTVAKEKGTVDTKCIAIAAGAVLAGIATAIIIRRLIASSK